MPLISVDGLVREMTPEEVSAITPSLAQRRAVVLDRVAARRSQAEQAFTFAGAPVKLDDKTQSRLSAAVAGLQRKPEGTLVEWEVSRGVYVSMDLNTLYTFGDAAFDHVQACFANSKALMAAVAVSDEPESIDIEQGWP